MLYLFMCLCRKTQQTQLWAGRAHTDARHSLQPSIPVPNSGVCMQLLHSCSKAVEDLGF